VRIERHDELGRRDPRPHPQIEPVVADHPAQKQIHPFAAAARGRAGKKITDAWSFRYFSICRTEVERQRARRKAIERTFDVLRRRIVTFEEEPFDRPRAVDHLLHDPQECDQIRPPRPSMDDIREGGAVAMGIESADVRSRLAVHHCEHAFNGLQHARNASERQGRGAQAGDLAILRRRPPADNLDGIGRRVRIVEALVQAIERRLQFTNLQSASSILNLQSAICNLQSAMAMIVSCADGS
jgi:hypothetical protein